MQSTGTEASSSTVKPALLNGCLLRPAMHWSHPGPTNLDFSRLSENIPTETRVTLRELSKYHFLSMLRSVTPGSGRWRGTAVVLALVLVFPATAPILVSQTDTQTVPTMCKCGCGNPQGACCCTARPTSPLSMSCAGSSEPDASSPQVNPLLGPPEPISIPAPEFSSREPAPVRLVISDVGPRPETPPPRT